MYTERGEKRGSVRLGPSLVNAKVRKQNLEKQTYQHQKIKNKTIYENRKRVRGYQKLDGVVGEWSWGIIGIIIG